MVNYGVIEEKMCDLCMGEYITYGIEMCIRDSNYRAISFYTYFTFLLYIIFYNLSIFSSKKIGFLLIVHYFNSIMLIKS